MKKRSKGIFLASENLISASTVPYIDFDVCKDMIDNRKRSISIKSLLVGVNSTLSKTQIAYLFEIGFFLR